MTMSDLISRKAALGALNGIRSIRTICGGVIGCYVSDLLKYRRMEQEVK